MDGLSIESFLTKTKRELQRSGDHEAALASFVACGKQAAVALKQRQLVQRHQRWEVECYARAAMCALELGRPERGAVLARAALAPRLTGSSPRNAVSASLSLAEAFRTSDPAQARAALAEARWRLASAEASAKQGHELKTYLVRLRLLQAELGVGPETAETKAAAAELCRAVGSRNEAATTRMIRRGWPHPDLPDGDCVLPMQIAVLTVCQCALISRGAARGSAEAAVAREYVEISRRNFLSLLAAGASLDARNAAGETALHNAAYSSCPEALELLLEHGAAPNLVDEQGFTPLLCTISNFGMEEEPPWLPAIRLRCVQLLLPHCSAGDINHVTTKLGYSVLLYAAKIEGSTSVLRALLRAGSDLRCRCLCLGHTPLSLAYTLHGGNAAMAMLRDAERAWTPATARPSRPSH